MQAPSFCVAWRRWYFEGVLCLGILFGFTVLVAPTPGLAVNFGPLTLVVYRASA